MRFLSIFAGVVSFRPLRFFHSLCFALCLITIGLNPNTALAQCVNVGGIVTCNIDDDDGFFSGSSITDLIIGEGVTIDDSGNGGNGAVGGSNTGIIALRTPGPGGPSINGLLLNNGNIFDTGSNNIAILVEGVLNRFINNGSVITPSVAVSNGVIIRSLENNGIISSTNSLAIGTRRLTSLINNGLISGGTDAISVLFNIDSIVNTGAIISNDTAIEARLGILRNVINSGVITGPNFALLEGGSGDTNLTLLPGSDIFGAIDLGGGTNSLVVGKGHSIDHVFASTPQIISTNGQPFVVDGSRVVVVAPETLLLETQDEIIFDLSQGIWSTVFNQIGDGRNPGASTFSGFVPQYSLGAFSGQEKMASQANGHMWASAFGNRRIQTEDTPLVGVMHDLAGFITGIDGRVNSQSRLGVFFGGSETKVDTANNQQKTEVESFFGGLYASLNIDGTIVDLGITGGSTEHDNTRIVDNNQVNGLQTVSSHFDGTFIAPEIFISNQIKLGAAIVKPSLRVGYAGLFLDGYRETGTTAPLTVNDRDVHLLHARFEMALVMHSQGPDSLGFHFSPYIGIEGRSLIEGEAVNVSLLGQNLSFNADDEEDIASVFAGLRFSVLKTETFGIFAGFEGGIDTEENSTLTGNLGVKWQF